ncbi:MAG: ATP-binding protein [Oscillospiraceae bacterium]|jgi:DNA replication protein DnaC|nr:ATP-binding protein [Oscillospiraceae bacterium]
MGYSKDVYEAVFAELAESRQKALYTAEKRREELFSSVPALRKIIERQDVLGLGFSRKLLANPEKSDELVQAFREDAEALIKEKNQLFKNIGVSPGYLEPPYSCKMCGDSGYIDGKRCSCLEKRLSAAACRKLNALSNLNLSNFYNFDLNLYPDRPSKNGGIVPREKMTAIYNYCVKYAEGFSVSSKNLLMIGATGLGKTHLSLAIAKTAIDKGFGVIYGSVSDLIGKVEREKFSGSSDYSTMDSLLGCDLLILDDLGTEFQSQFTSSVVYNIINSRAIRRLPTIINTNLNFDELEKTYTPRIVSRLSVYGKLVFIGNDIRPLLDAQRPR